VRRALFILNPSAGRRRALVELIPALTQVLATHGIAATALTTEAPGTAASLAASAAATGTDMVFACGGDGTVHEVLQGLVGTSTALGIIPIGTANALARNLGISRDPILAAAQQATANPVRIPVGQIAYRRASAQQSTEVASRYFAVMAGAGPDGALVYSLLAGQKSAMGRAAYYAHAARLFLTKSFPPFRLACRVAGSSEWRDELVVSVMCARIGDLGGAFGRLTRGSSLHSPALRLVLVRPPARIGLAAWFAFSQLGMERLNPWLLTLDVQEFRCDPLHSEPIHHAQADGEWIGGLPISVRLLPDALSLLIPPGPTSRL
jgi:YegS/Rv2252/BmrU family lipid kinase